MNFHIVILMAVVVCALALPLPDEEVPVLQKVTEKPVETTTTGTELVKKPEPSLNAMEEGTKAVVGNLTAGTEPKVDVKSEKDAADKEAATTPEDDIVEVPKSLPVKAREETEAAAPPFAGVRAEPKEGVEIGEAKSTASVPEADETEKKPETTTTAAADAKPSTETTTTAAALDKKSAPEEKPKAEEGAASPSTTTKPAPTGETKTEATKEATESSSADHKVSKEAHTHSSEGNKSEESAESKESEESNESNKSK